MKLSHFSTQQKNCHFKNERDISDYLFQFLYFTFENTLNVKSDCISKSYGKVTFAPKKPNITELMQFCCISMVINLVQLFKTLLWKISNIHKGRIVQCTSCTQHQVSTPINIWQSPSLFVVAAWGVVF